MQKSVNLCLYQLKLAASGSILLPNTTLYNSSLKDWSSILDRLIYQQQCHMATSLLLQTLTWISTLIPRTNLALLDTPNHIDQSLYQIEMSFFSSGDTCPYPLDNKDNFVVHSSTKAPLVALFPVYKNMTRYITWLNMTRISGSIMFAHYPISCKTLHYQIQNCGSCLYQRWSWWEPM